MTLDVKFEEQDQTFGADFNENEQNLNVDFGELQTVGGGENGATFIPNVSQSGVISWTNDKGLENPTPVNIKGAKGDKGDRGEQGIQGLKGDKGEQGAQGIQGLKGEKGEGFSISKTYPSVSAMQQGFSTDGVPLNGFVLINTGNVNDEDNAKLFVKLQNGYSYLTDLSGSQGIKGEKGEQGIQGIQGERGEKGDNGADGYTPVKGTDYFTPADISQIVSSVVEALPKYNGEVVSV